MKNRIHIASILIAATLLALPAAPAVRGQTVSVRLLNMSDEPFGPVLVATHPSHASPLLDPSEPPSEALRQLAGGSEVMLEDELEALAQRHSHVRAGRIAGPAPGQEVRAEIPVTAYHRNVSLAASLPGGGIVALAPRHLSRDGWNRVDLLSWEVGGTAMVHRSRPSPIARAWLRYEPPRRPRRGLPSLTPAQQRERESCLAGSPTCVWRLRNGRGECIDCLPPLRPNAARTHCI